MTEENKGEEKRWKVIYADDKVLFAVADPGDEEE
jgi:hypothetical protein|tara:strand:+ start:3317 stop:3418 length:102 start_codon:yes stop_codon:yes gene_type:complete